MTLIDTSAWVDFFRNRPSAFAVDMLLANGEAALCGPIVTEIRRGLTAADRRKVLPLLEGCETLPQPENLWLEAGDLGFWLSRKGVVVKSLDLLIATYALAHSVELLSTDTDFVHMQKAGVGLQLFQWN